MVKKLTHISGSLEEFFTTVTVENNFFFFFFFSNHDAVRIAIEKNYIDFHINP